MKTKIYSAPEVAMMLRRLLGTMRAWDDCLADMRRSKTHVHGHVLMPVCRIHDGRALRPGYMALHIAAFVKAVRAANGEAKASVPPQHKVVEIDLADGRTWKQRKVRACSPPVSVSRSRGRASATMPYHSSYAFTVMGKTYAPGRLRSE